MRPGLDYWRTKKASNDLRDIEELHKCLTSSPEIRIWAASALSELGESIWVNLVQGKPDDIDRLEQCQNANVADAARNDIIRGFEWWIRNLNI